MAMHTYAIVYASMRGLPSPDLFVFGIQTTKQQLESVTVAEDLLRLPLTSSTVPSISAERLPRCL